jgi:hypothetical protein
MPVMTIMGTAINQARFQRDMNTSTRSRRNAKVSAARLSESGLPRQPDRFYAFGGVTGTPDWLLDEQLYPI